MGAPSSWGVCLGCIWTWSQLSEAEGAAEAPEHIADVAGAPVDPAARGAAEKAGLGPKHVGRDLSADTLLLDGSDRLVAFEAAAARVGRQEGRTGGAGHLAELLFQVGAFDQDCASGGASLDEAA